MKKTVNKSKNNKKLKVKKKKQNNNLKLKRARKFGATMNEPG